MDTINSIASAASKVIWGEGNKDKDNTAKGSNEEPISGVQGDVSKGEPYDIGNLGETADVVGPIKSPGVEDRSNAAQPSSNMVGDSTGAQNDTRHPSDETTSPGAEAKKSDVDNVDPLDPKSLKGPGPRPIEQVAKENGGDAGNMGKGVGDDATAKAPCDGNKPQAQGKSVDGNQPASGKSESEGTGEKYVKSSGLQADGGDFDAARAGAGREADRLLEQKGIHVDKPSDKKKQQPGSPKGKDASLGGKSSSPERKGVKGLGQKIKAKLRRSSNTEP